MPPRGSKAFGFWGNFSCHKSQALAGSDIRLALLMRQSEHRVLPSSAPECCGAVEIFQACSALLRAEQHRCRGLCRHSLRRGRTARCCVRRKAERDQPAICETGCGCFNPIITFVSMRSLNRAILKERGTLLGNVPIRLRRYNPEPLLQVPGAELPMNGCYSFENDYEPEL